MKLEQYNEYFTRTVAKNELVVTGRQSAEYARMRFQLCTGKSKNLGFGFLKFGLTRQELLYINTCIIT